MIEDKAVIFEPGGRQLWERIVEAAVRSGRDGGVAIQIADGVCEAWQERRERGRNAQTVDVTSLGVKDFTPTIGNGAAQ